MSLAAMVRTVALMRNPRRGHDAQGKLKRVKFDSSAEGYSNYMAPMRMQRIAQQTAMTDRDTHKVYDDSKILRPAVDTYLTPEWDEFVPFPNSECAGSYIVRGTDIQQPGRFVSPVSANRTTAHPKDYMALFIHLRSTSMHLRLRLSTSRRAQVILVVHSLTWPVYAIYQVMYAIVRIN